MIKTLIFDFGDVFINLDKQGALNNALKLFGIDAFTEDMTETNENYEQGFISTKEFLEFYSNKFQHLSEDNIIAAWNYIIKDFPEHRYQWIKKIAATNEYKLILLSNTNHIHIEFIKKEVSFYNGFKTCFDKFYLSHEIGLRKPNIDIYQYVLNENNLNPNECVFIDDTKENTDAANDLGIYTWNIDETQEDVVNLFSTKAHLF